MNHCVWCNTGHTTGLMLCPTCESRAIQLREAKGESIRPTTPTEETNL